MKKYRLRSGLVLTDICGETLLIATPQARPFCPKATCINPTGAFIIKLLDERALSSDDIAGLLAAEYEVDKTRDLKKDITSFLYQLQADGFIIPDEE